MAEELAFGLENAGMERGTMQIAVERTAGLLGLGNQLDQDPAQLSGGQLRRLAIGCAIIAGPPVLVMDEPLASLDTAGANDLASLVRDLLKRGTAVVMLSQMIDPLLLEADTWVVLSGGTVMACGAPTGRGRRPRAEPSGTGSARRGRRSRPAPRSRSATSRSWP